TVVIIELLARAVFSIDAETGSLLAAGSGICGVSAVVAVAESIRADESRIAYAAATVLLFDATTLFVYPAIGHLLDLSDMVFGVWAGLTMFSTGPVTAAGFSYSQTAGHWALLVKLTRNALIGIAAVAYAVYYTRRSAGTGSVGGLTDLWRSFPKFIFGFLGVMIVANLGFLTPAAIDSLSHASDWAFMLAFAGLGLEIDIGELRSTGYKPVLVVLVGLLAMSTTMLVVVGNVFLGTNVFVVRQLLLTNARVHLCHRIRSGCRSGDGRLYRVSLGRSPLARRIRDGGPLLADRADRGSEVRTR